MLFFVVFLAVIWGVAWALFLEVVPFGQWLVSKRTWITVVIGVGVDLGLALLVVPWEFWWKVALVVALSAVGIVGRSLYQEWDEWMELLRGNEVQIHANREEG